MNHKAASHGSKRVVEDAITSTQLGGHLFGITQSRAQREGHHGEGPTARSALLTLAVLGWVGSGMVVLVIAEGLDSLSAAYVLVQMITTIGYGDVKLHSNSDSTKAFLSLYVLFCCIVVGGVMLTGANHALQATHETISERIVKLKTNASGGLEESPAEVIRQSKASWLSVKREDKHKAKKRRIGDFERASIFCVVALASGTLFYGAVEKCVCSYKETQVLGCDPENCEATGGYTKSMLDAWYMSCVSLTTIGFGDFAPKSRAGRVFSIFWLLSGVCAVGNFTCQFSKKFLEANRRQRKLQINIDEIFAKIDKDGSGTLDRFEFMSFALMEYGMLTEEDLDAIMKQFNDLDKDGSGCVSKEEVAARYGEVREEEAKECAHGLMTRISVVLGNAVGNHELDDALQAAIHYREEHDLDHHDHTPDGQRRQSTHHMFRGHSQRGYPSSGTSGNRSTAISVLAATANSQLQGEEQEAGRTTAVSFSDALAEEIQADEIALPVTSGKIRVKPVVGRQDSGRQDPETSFAIHDLVWDPMQKDPEDGVIDIESKAVATEASCDSRPGPLGEATGSTPPKSPPTPKRTWRTRNVVSPTNLLQVDELPVTYSSSSPRPTLPMPKMLPVSLGNPQLSPPCDILDLDALEVAAAGDYPQRDKLPLPEAPDTLQQGNDKPFKKKKVKLKKTKPDKEDSEDLKKGRSPGPSPEGSPVLGASRNGNRSPNLGPVAGSNCEVPPTYWSESEEDSRDHRDRSRSRDMGN